ncbi:MAG: hypothetical protein ABIJ21_09040 [Nanoarchaeota archaeon]
MDLKLLEKYAQIVEKHPVFPDNNEFFQLGIVKMIDVHERHILTTDDGRDALKGRALEVYRQVRRVFKEPLQGTGDLDRFFFRAQAGDRIIVSLGKIESHSDELSCAVTLRVQKENVFLKGWVLKTAYGCERNQDIKKIVEESIAGYAQKYHVAYKFA